MPPKKLEAEEREEPSEPETVVHEVEKVSEAEPAHIPEVPKLLTLEENPHFINLQSQVQYITEKFSQTADAFIRMEATMDVIIKRFGIIGTPSTPGSSQKQPPTPKTFQSPPPTTTATTKRTRTTGKSTATTSKRNTNE